MGCNQSCNEFLLSGAMSTKTKPHAMYFRPLLHLHEYTRYSSAGHRMGSQMLASVLLSSSISKSAECCAGFFG